MSLVHTMIHFHKHDQTLIDPHSLKKNTKKAGHTLTPVIHPVD